MHGVQNQNRQSQLNMINYIILHSIETSKRFIRALGFHENHAQLNFSRSRFNYSGHVPPATPEMSLIVCALEPGGVDELTRARGRLPFIFAEGSQFCRTIWLLDKY